MPKFKKQTISKYIKTGCKRFLALELYRSEIKSEKELAYKYNMPDPIVARPSANIFGQVGKKAEKLLYNLIKDEFGDEYAILFNDTNQSKENMLNLFKNNLENKLFLIEAEFLTDDLLEVFINQFGESVKNFKDKLSIADIRPDLICVVIPEKDKQYYEVQGDGTLTEIKDNRILLSIIDVKNTEKSNSGYDIEVVLYSMLLTLWLKTNNLSDKYAVISQSGIFPAALKVNPFSQKYESLENENIIDKYFEFLSYVEYIEHDQLVITLRNIIVNDLIPILKNPQDWEKLDWHIGKKCGLCDWLAYEDWLSEDNKDKITNKHCHSHALDIDHLSQIPFLSNAMRKVLSNDSISTLSKVIDTNGEEDTYKKHSKLKVNSTLIPKRANSIQKNIISFENRYIYSMPRFALTNIFITLNFDPSTRIVSSISSKCYWKEFANYYNPKEKEEYTNDKKFSSSCFFTEEGNDESEREMLFYFLNQINDYFMYANDIENNPHPDFKNSTYHMYFWDKTQYDELKKLIGKHLGVIFEHKLLKSLIWLFGTEDILEDYQTVKSPNVTFVKDIIHANLALNIRFDYTLFQVAKAYTKFDKKISKAFYDPFSDYIPKERLYEIWLKVKKPNYQEIRNLYMLTAKSQVDALQLISVQITKDLKELIKGEANPISFDIFKSFEGITKLPVDSKLWYLHHRLNEEYAFLSNELDLFKNVDDMEANYKAIVLERPLNKVEEDSWLQAIGLTKTRSLLTYKVTADSCNSKIKDNSSELRMGIFDDISFINKKFYTISKKYNIYDDFVQYASSKKIYDITKVKIVNFDRINGVIAINLKADYKALGDALQSLISLGILDLSKKLYLIEVSFYPASYHTLGYIKAIKTPLISHAEEKTLKAIGLNEDKKGIKTSPKTMASEILWNASTLQNEKSKLFEETLVEESYLTVINNMKLKPNKKQKEAIFNALINRLSIIWGPPGTGKTNTASILIKTLLLLLKKNNIKQNILLSAFTYQACIELFEKVYSQLDACFKDIEFIVIKSGRRKEEFENFITRSHEWGMNIRIVNQPKSDSDDNYFSIKNELRWNSNKIKVVISPIAALSVFYNDNCKTGSVKECKYENIGKYFDYTLLDEASQCDVANALAILYGLKEDGQLVILGDHLQMPPIHQVKPPLHIEYNVGSFLNYLRRRHNVQPTMLNINYRSTLDIVNYIKTLGYSDLESARNKLEYTVNNSKIIDNPYINSLNSSKLFENIMQQENEVLALTHFDELSSQANSFEAEIVAGVIIDAYNKFYDGSNKEVYDKKFWSQYMGVVTPHKAQKVMIAKYLYEVFIDSKQLIDNAIDTVERFQGSQRRFIIVSFGVGDPDIISQEEEFLLNLNRTNVAISRAEDKILVIISEKLIHHLPEDKEVIKTSKAIKSYVHQYCNINSKYLLKYKGEDTVINLRIHK